MASTQLSDIIDVTVFQDLEPVNSPEKTAFFESGAVASSPLLDSLAAAAGKTAELPFWKDLDQSEAPNLSSDDHTSDASPKKVTQGEQIARKAFLNQGWSSTDLATEIAMGADALDHVRAKVDSYWMRQWQRRLIATSRGIQADNAANDGGDMTHDAASDSIAGQSSTTRFSRSNFINAAYTMGDSVDGISAMAVHSFVQKQMIEQGDVEDVRDANGVLLERTYMGRTIITDDTLPAIAGATDGIKYMSVLFGTGAFGYGSATPQVPVEVSRNAQAGDGGGVEELWTRKTWLLHPFGYQNTGTPAANSFDLSELSEAATWDRVVERKNVPLAFLWTN